MDPALCWRAFKTIPGGTLVFLSRSIRNQKKKKKTNLYKKTMTSEATVDFYDYKYTHKNTIDRSKTQIVNNKQGVHSTRDDSRWVTE